VSFNTKTGQLKVPATAVYCVKVDVITEDAAGVWTNYAACLNGSTGTIVVSRDDVTDLRVAFCLSRRFDVCSSTVTAAMHGSPLLLFSVSVDAVV